MTIDELQEALSSTINQSALAALNGRISLHCGPPDREPDDRRPDHRRSDGRAAESEADNVLHLELRDGELHWLEPGATTDATFYFDSCEHAHGLLTGSANVMTEFMAGRFRSSGYLLWTFPLLGVFRG